MAGNVKMQNEGSGNSAATTQQLEQLLKLLPSLNVGGTETDDDMDASYSGMVSCNLVDISGKEWILDSGATHHMTGCKTMMCEIEPCSSKNTINLPTRKSSHITGAGKVMLNEEITLHKVMLIPDFKQNLLSVQKLCKDNNYKVTFLPKICIIEDCTSAEVKGIGISKSGLYYLVDAPVQASLKKIETELKRHLQTHVCDQSRQVMSAEVNVKVPNIVTHTKKMSLVTTWH